MANASDRDDPHLPERDEGPELTGRQRQILDLLRAGKVNKEIANELGIGLGTVKQHVVALFKKLKVRNRAMAISHRAAQSAAPHAKAQLLGAAGLLERRPCVVLSVALPETAPGSAGRLLHQTLAAYAFDHDALFLARRGNAGDLIFGIQSPGEHDLLLVLRAGHIVFEALAAHERAVANSLRGGLTAGTAVASMQRRGGWSGEAIASPAIAQARELAAQAAAGQLALNPAAQELLQALTPCAPAAVPAELPFRRLGRLPWPAGDDRQAPVGRDQELATLDALLSAASAGRRLVYLEGETGMGKSRLCRHVADQCGRRGGRVRHFVCVPGGEAGDLHALPGGEAVSLDAVAAALAAKAGGRPKAVIVDDCHLLSADALARLTRQAEAAPGGLVLLAGRRFPESRAAADATLRLGRLDPVATERLVAGALGAEAPAAFAATVARAASGVPLFALQLAGHGERRGLPLPLRFVIGARMDGLGLDRLLLRSVAAVTTPVSGADLAAAMRETPEAVLAAAAQAIAGGVLRRDERGCFSFTHPLLRRAVMEAQVD